MAPLQRPSPLLLLCVVGMILLAGCGGSQANPPAPGPLGSANVHLVFVSSEDLAFNAPGDVNPNTANLTNRGLQRSLSMATFLNEKVLGSANASAIYAMVPTTHPQTSIGYPDMTGLVTIQQFAMLNQVSLSYPSNLPVTANSFPINISYSSAELPDDVAQPLMDCPIVAGGAYSCQGLDFRDINGVNESLVEGLIQQEEPGFYVFSAPWETISNLMQNINQAGGYKLSLPAAYPGPNYVYVISIAPSGEAELLTYNSNLDPPDAYPTLPAGGIVSASCLPVTTNTTFQVQVKGGSGGAVIPAGINTNETVYLVRHAEAHPTAWWEDGNYIGAGQWRALDLPNALRGKIQPDVVYSIDPAQVTPGSTSSLGDMYSYVRTNATVLPYAIANGLPYRLATNFEMGAQNPPEIATEASNFFFFGGAFSNRVLLVGWEHDHIPTTVNALLTAFHGGQTAPNWPDDDYDTVWTVKLDAHGNVSVDNLTCEGISSSALPATAPQF